MSRPGDGFAYTEVDLAATKTGGQGKGAVLHCKSSYLPHGLEGGRKSTGNVAPWRMPDKENICDCDPGPAPLEKILASGHQNVRQAARAVAATFAIGTKIMMPWSEQDIARLQDLGLPNLAGKRVLDLDCGPGFFCAYAAYAQASQVCGWSTDSAAIGRAQKLLPECHFSCRDWHDILCDEAEGAQIGQYDIIIAPHTLHHGKALADNIPKLMAHVSPWGTLVLEILLVTGQKEQVFFKLGKDPNLHPAQNTFRAMLETWVWRHVHQVKIRELPLVCDVYHIFHAKPEAILFMGHPFSGKSHISHLLASERLPRIHGDILLQQIQRGETWAPDALVELLQKTSDIKNFYILIWMVCKSNLLDALVDALDRQAGGRPFIFDGYIPEAYHGTVLASLDSKGYFVTNTDIFSSRVHDKRAIPPEKYEDAFSLFLLKHFKNTLASKQED